MIQTVVTLLIISKQTTRKAHSITAVYLHAIIVHFYQLTKRNSNLLLLKGLESTDGFSLTVLVELLPKVTDKEEELASVNKAEGFKILLLLPNPEIRIDITLASVAASYV